MKKIRERKREKEKEREREREKRDTPLDLQHILRGILF
jgi:hypothetical protein